MQGTCAHLVIASFPSSYDIGDRDRSAVIGNAVD